MKKCTKCEQTKPYDCFSKNTRSKDGFCTWCKICSKKYRLKWYEKNKESFLKKKREYNKQNKDKVAYQNKKYREEHTDQLKEYSKQYRLSNIDKIKTRDKKYQSKIENKLKRNIREKQRRDDDILYRLTISLRNRLYRAIKNNSKSGSAVNDLGCTINKFKMYIENKFQPGMMWENWGVGKNCWHIDHITPLSKFDLNNRQELLKACHYTNLQPLWANENIVKRNKIFDK